MEQLRSEIPENTRKLLEMRRTDPEQLSGLLAEKRVKRGKRWLKRNAPVGWHRNLFEPYQGKEAWFRANNTYDNECVLALAFESRADLANHDGDLTYASVTNHFALTHRQCRPLGFEEQPCNKRYPGFGISSALLNVKWESAMRVFGGFAHRPYRHEPRSLRTAA